MAEFANDVITHSLFPGTRDEAISLANRQLAGTQLTTGDVSCPDAKYGDGGSTGLVKCDPGTSTGPITMTPSVRTTCAGVIA